MSIQAANVWCGNNHELRIWMTELGLLDVDAPPIEEVSPRELVGKVISGTPAWFALPQCRWAIEPMLNPSRDRHASRRGIPFDREELRSKVSGFGVYSVQVITGDQAHDAQTSITAIVNSNRQAVAELRERLDLDPDRVPTLRRPAPERFAEMHIAAAGLALRKAYRAASCTFFPSRVPGQDGLTWERFEQWASVRKPVTLEIRRRQVIPCSG